MRKILALCAASLMILGGLAAMVWSDAPPLPQRGDLDKAFQAGNYKDAFEGFRSLALSADDDARQVGHDLQMGINCLRQLGRIEEADDFREAVIKLHAKNWRLLHAAADSLNENDGFGFIIAGKFQRGQHRGGGKVVNARERDRIRALQLMVQAMPLANDDAAKGEVANFYILFAQKWLGNRGASEAWRLQYLSDLKELPDYEDGWYYGNSAGGAPVDEKGEPVYHELPKSFEAAKTDGERWRWCLGQAVEMDAAKLNDTRKIFADFLHEQFGVQTMAQYGYFFGRGPEADDDKKNESGTFDLHTLADEETISRLASGIKRFKLPDRFNFIKIYQQIADDPKTGHGSEALETLAQIFENRRQYPRAAEFWQRVIKEYGPGQNNYRQQRLEQIVKAWGRFEPISTQPAERGATIEFRYRNAKKVSFEAHAVRVDKLLDDVKAYLKTKPAQLDWQKVNVSELGWRLVQENQTQYIGDKVAGWDLELKPRENHFDKRITVTTPLQKAGAYLLTAKMADGNTSQIILWVSDTAIVKKAIAGEKTMYYVADAISGKPIAKANLEFFGYYNKHVGGNQFTTETMNFAEFSNADGLVFPETKQQPREYQWLITARTDGGRFAYLGFSGVWHGLYYDAEYNATKIYAITDRPVYRPKQTVKFKFWVRHAKYDQEDTSDFADKDFQLEVMNPKGEKILAKGFKSDAYGGFEGELELAADAALGSYQIYIPTLGGGNFRVEEYKKPEFEVTVDAPKRPVMLGEKITATIKAKYYFGAPVTKAKVKYKVMRTSYNQTWYPTGRWDWFYGPGYWWFAYDYYWYPGWGQWGCKRPIAWWWFGGAHQPPEMVADREVEIGPDGIVKVEIDTALAKETHPDQDHQYSITAEVVDESRRTIVGSGNVLVARKPFKVFTWIDRGYYRTGDVIKADFMAQTLDHKPVKGTGKLKLLKISYDKNNKPVETPVQQWDLDTDAQGRAEIQIKAAVAGQYRLSYLLIDKKKHEIEGGYLFTVIGQNFDGAQYRFNDIELIPDKREYEPGQKVKLQVNVNREQGTVLLFVRPANGIYLAPKVMRLEGKSTVEEIEVSKKDMPNFFIEAVTIANGKLFTEVKEVVVPPEKRVLNVLVTPSAETYRPGEKAKVKLQLTDFFGKPFVGSTVLAIYDKSVEYVSGGSNVPDIKAFFWKWRRGHYPQTETNLGRYSNNLFPRNHVGMQNLGVFGETVATEMDSLMKSDRKNELSESLRDGRPGEGGGRGAMAAKSAAAPGAAMDAAAGARQLNANGLNRAELQNAAQDPGAPPPPNLVEPSVRTKFADTAYWAGSLTTDKQGMAEISLDMPENLTTWKIKAWGMGHGTKVGEGDAEVITRKNLIIRMQTPRFFVQKDEVVLSANVHNYLDKKKSVQVVLDIDGKLLSPLGVKGGKNKDGGLSVARTVEVEAGGETRVDWRVSILDEGETKIRMKALTDQESDAMEMSFPVFVHGMLKTESWAGAIRPDKDSAKFTIQVPKERRISQTRLEIRYSPTLAGAMVDALPYLVDYPYDSTDQTLNRFLPTVITQKILLDMKLDLKAIQEKRTNLNAQEIGDDRERAKGWKRYDRNPVFDEGEVRAMVKAGVQRIGEMQLSDGGWGWFSGWGEHSWAHTTAYMVHGLQIAVKNDVAVVPGVLERGIAWLTNYQNQQVGYLKNAATKTQPWKDHADELDAFVFMVLRDADVKNAEMLDFLYRDRTKLAVYAKAMFGLALHKLGDKEKLDMILKNIEQFVVQDEENQTAYLKLPENNYWWYWYGSEVEANSYYLKLLSRTDPKSEAASRLVKYLINNRKHATYWNSTRDTSVAIEALAEFLKASGESKPDMTIEVLVDGKQRKSVKITAENLFTFDNKLVMEGDAVDSGAHDVQFKKTGQGPLYFNAYLANFTLEDDIRRAGLEIKVNRKYYKLVKADKSVKVSGSRGQAVDQKVEKYNRQELENLATLKSGDLVEIELEIDSKNDYEYLIFEDMKAAGFEPVELRSGYNGNSLGAYMELRDNRVAFFARTVARGKHSVSYRMRAEIPGKFSALPTRGSAVYAPELKASSDEIKLNIVD